MLISAVLVKVDRRHIKVGLGILVALVVFRRIYECRLIVSSLAVTCWVAGNIEVLCQLVLRELILNALIEPREDEVGRWSDLCSERWVKSAG